MAEGPTTSTIQISDNSESEAYLLLLLSDSNLPTGGFVASSGLESYYTHGFCGSNAQAPASLVPFVASALHSYAALSVSTLRQAHQIVHDLQSENLDEVVTRIGELDARYESLVLNHVARRASKPQGIAFLTLYTRAYAEVPPRGDVQPGFATQVASLVERLRLLSRKDGSRFTGHLPVCFGVLCAALGLAADRAVYLHLFLQARSILSSAVRLNIIGPYLAQRFLLHDVKPLIGEIIAQEASLKESGGEDDEDDGAANTWPLGELLIARHDCLHSRIFNS